FCFVESLSSRHNLPAFPLTHGQLPAPREVFRMKSTIRILLLSASLIFPSLAAADSVSEVNAKAVETRLLSVMTKDLADAGALSVKAAGDQYEVLFDLRKALEKTIAPWTVKEANAILHT